MSNGSGMYLAMFLACASCCLIMLLPVALRGGMQVTTSRDEAWRDQLPWFLRALRPVMRWYSSAVESSLTPQRREVLQARLDSAGAAYLISPAEFLVIRRVVAALGAAISTTAILLF